MAQIFPKRANKTPILAAAALGFLGMAVTGFFWYYGSPKFTDVGYRPVQPVPYSHKLHAGDLGMDCRYCHVGVETAAAAMVPPTATCMNCHKLVLPQSEKLLPVRESFANNTPIQWVKVHKIPDYAYFNHSIHVNRGVGCESCHGNIAQEEVVQQRQPLSMSWCLDCHRNPDQHLRDLQSGVKVTDMNWTPPADQAKFAARIKQEKKIAPPEDCSGCHR
ncbi:cytochrome c3 family protein [bacterium]|nr:cytochrome c3 family protein [bacterium]NUN46379.1 ammonia-forming cytochrome c nitrite reductase subunit c552 [bacterium]HMW33054.1 cytochrome c3 family protein [bacterium]HMZ04926.1 cytochrome c3 family protein [bacterium]HNC49495.1 cytochrome c3 family protein [bacterium]